MRCLITSRKIMKSRPAVVENFVMAWLESVRFIFNNKREAKQVISKYTLNTEDTHLEDAWNTFVTQTEIPPYASVTQLQGQINMMAEDQPDLARLDAKTIIDNSIIKRLDDSGWIKKLFGK